MNIFIRKYFAAAEAAAAAATAIIALRFMSDNSIQFCVDSLVCVFLTLIFVQRSHKLTVPYRKE